MQSAPELRIIEVYLRYLDDVQKLRTIFGERETQLNALKTKIVELQTNRRE
jgi:hypothetical protein